MNDDEQREMISFTLFWALLLMAAMRYEMQSARALWCESGAREERHTVASVRCKKSMSHCH